MSFIDRLQMSKRTTALFIVGGLLAVSPAGSSAHAQVQERPKSIPSAPAEQAAKAVAPSPSWVVACTKKQAGLMCRAAQSVSLRQGNRNARVTAVLRIPPETKAPNLTLQVPLGVYLPPGVAIKFGDATAKALAFQSCNPNGCIAEYSPSGAEIAALQKGAPLELSVRTPDKAAITFKVPATGFDAAYSRMVGK